jgi:hypothetical protein
MILAWSMRLILVVLLAALAYDVYSQENYAVMDEVTTSHIYSCDTHEQIQAFMFAMQAADNKIQAIKKEREGCGPSVIIYEATAGHETYGVNFGGTIANLRILKLQVYGVVTAEGPKGFDRPQEAWSWSAFPIITRAEFDAKEKLVGAVAL